MQASPVRCCFYHLPGSCLVAQTMSLARRLRQTRFLGKLGKELLSSRVSFSGRLEECLLAENDTVLNDRPLPVDQLLLRHIWGNCLCVPTAQNPLFAMALVARVEVQAPVGWGTVTCGCTTGALIPTLPPSSSSACGANSLPVLRPTSCPPVVRPAANV